MLLIWYNNNDYLLYFCVMTGPYMFGVSFATYLCSKEIYIMEHEYYNGLSLAILCIVIVKKLGPSVAAALDKDIDVTNLFINHLTLVHKTVPCFRHTKKVGNRVVLTPSTTWTKLSRTRKRSSGVLRARSSFSKPRRRTLPSSLRLRTVNASWPLTLRFVPAYMCRFEIAIIANCFY